jgi:chemotaxis protein methyltransferase CheR
MSEAIAPASAELSDRDFERFRALAYEKFGLHLTCAKRDLVAVRLGKKLRELRLPSFRAYYEHVVADQSGHAMAGLIDALSTNHTAFLRERSHFEFLAHNVLALLRRRARIEVWCAPCATGEEAYSILITLLEQLGVPPRPEVSVRAVDISTKALEFARRGIYPAERLRELPPAMLEKYFRRAAAGKQPAGARAGAQPGFEIRPEFARMVEFSRVNLIEATPSPRLYPVIFCRNMMIYFDRPTQERVIELMARSLEPGGYLFIGHSESLLGIRHRLEYVQPAVYRLPASEAK